MKRFLIGCACWSLAVCVTSTGWSQLRSPLISELTAQRHGLTRAWFTQVEIDPSRDHIQSVTLFDGMVLVQSKLGTIHGLDSESGRKLWTQRVGKSYHPTTEIGASDEHVAVLNGSNLYVFTRMDGKMLWDRPRRVIGAPGAGPGVSSQYVFVPTITGIIEAYALNNPRKPAWLYNSGGRALVQPVVSKGSVSWPTDRGLFYVAEASDLTVRFRTEARDDIVAPPAYIPPHFYVGSLDGHLYKVHERSGALSWRFTTGEPVSERPIGVNGRIYMTARHGGLYCVMADKTRAMEAAATAKRDAEDRGEKPLEDPEDLAEIEEGTEIWRAPYIVKLLAVSPMRVYGVDKSGRMRIVRADTGSPLDSISTENLDLTVVNHISDRIFIGSKSGLIQCLHEPQLKQPLSYAITEDTEPKKVEVRQEGLEPEADLFGGDMPDEGKPAAKPDDPFADDPFADPAGGDAAGDADAGGDASGDAGGAAADPFSDDPFK